MSPEEHYVRNATRGLRGKERQETQTELLSHLTERTRQLTLTGLTPEQASTQAMQELGPAPTVARSLRRTQHVHPALSAAALLAFATLLLWPVPELLYARTDPFNSTTGQSVRELRAEGYLTVREANSQLKPYGIQLRHHNESWELRHAGLPTASLASATSWNCQGPVTSMAADQPRYLLSGVPTVAYVNPSALLVCMSEAGWPLELDGQQIRLQGKAFPDTWTREIANMFYVPQVSQSLSQLPRHLWSSPTAPIPQDEPSVIAYPNDLSKIRWSARHVETTAQHVGLLVRFQLNGISWPEKVSYSAPMFISFTLPVSDQGTVNLPVRVPHAMKVVDLTLKSNMNDWLMADNSTFPAILVALPDRTDAPVDLTPLPFTP
ncbi:permease prefix domain 1-containing protein [Deinococcus aquaticus]|uniref:Permease prefix domain 1-containing protein n=1 Tax=Deinococcus aquaticus TaxID=328692 RepID=A0ABY7UXB0_9DEIO|nr:permease prefix domain 1-containing protein [Deinococcus aquaticus]WDA57510.1 permease prefix domain 1-containing protein [Deinococcus aquaticus]